MTTDDRGLAQLVRSTLDEQFSTLPVHPPAWPAVEGALVRVRQARRRRLRRVVSTSVAMVLAAAVGVQTGLLPYPAWAPAIGLTAAPSLLDVGVVRGSLHGDAVFLRELREVAAGRSARESEGTWRVPSVDDVDVLYAGDVGGRRVALVESRMRTGVLQSRVQVWFAGPAGSAAEELTELSSGPTVATAHLWFSPVQGQQEGLLLVVTARRAPLLLAGPRTYAADGTVHRLNRSLTPDATGVIAERIRTGLPADLALRLPTLDDGAQDGWVDLLDAQGVASDPLGGRARRVPTALVHPTGRPPSARDLGRLQESLGNLLSASRLTVDPARCRYLWKGALGSWTDVRVVAATAPSGAHLVGIDLWAPQPDEPGTAIGTSVRTALAAGPVERLAVAWQMDGPGDKGDRRPTRSVGVLGPAGATTARMTQTTGQVVTTPLTAGVGLFALSSPDVQGSVVQFLDAGGAVVATARILDQHADLPSGLS